MGIREREAAAESVSELSPLSTIWAIKLDQEEWPDTSGIALFHIADLWLELLPGERPNLSESAAGSRIVVIRDRTSGVGKDRMLYWEVTVVDPIVEDVLAELNREEPEAQRQKKLTRELS